jgi:hypothetical protein
VIDTHAWTSQAVDPRADSAVVARDALLSSGSSWDSGKQQLVGNGLKVYGPDGRKRFQLLGKRAIVQQAMLTHWCPSPTPSDPQKHPAHDGRDAAGDPVHRPLDLDERSGRAPRNLHK